MKIRNLTKNNYRFNSVLEIKADSIEIITEDDLQFFPAIQLLIDRNEFEIVKDEIKEIVEKVEEVVETTEQIKPKRARKSKKEVK